MRGDSRASVEVIRVLARPTYAVARAMNLKGGSLHDLGEDVADAFRLESPDLEKRDGCFAAATTGGAIAAGVFGAFLLFAMILARDVLKFPLLAVAFELTGVVVPPFYLAGVACMLYRSQRSGADYKRWVAAGRPTVWRLAARARLRLVDAVATFLVFLALAWLYAGALGFIPANW